jgi:hypothetical protein
MIRLCTEAGKAAAAAASDAGACGEGLKTKVVATWWQLKLHRGLWLPARTAQSCPTAVKKADIIDTVKASISSSL